MSADLRFFLQIGVGWAGDVLGGWIDGWIYQLDPDLPWICPDIDGFLDLRTGSGYFRSTRFEWF